MTKPKVKSGKSDGESLKPPKPDVKQPTIPVVESREPVSLKSKPVEGEVTVEVSQPKVDDDVGFLGKLLSLKEDSGPGGEPPKKKRGRPPKAKTTTLKLEPEELANLLLVPGLLMAAQRFLPEPVQPNEDEALGFCGPLARIIARHLPDIPMSADAIDLGRMMLAGIAYWMRVQPILAALKEAEAEGEIEEGLRDASVVKGSDDGRYKTEVDNAILTGEPGRSGLVAGSSEPSS